MTRSAFNRATGICRLSLFLTSTSLTTQAVRLALLLPASFVSAAYGQAVLPNDGMIASGAATISASHGSVIINQSSERAVINWDSFSVGQGQSVVFNHPGIESATLNRVTGMATSVIAGQITSVGAVYLVNPNGIAITATGSVRTGGGFVASTIDIADADFTAGNLNFTGKGASGHVSNAGHITAGSGAYVALLGGSISNAGYINVPLGRVGLGSGESVTLDLNGNAFMQVAVPTGTLTQGSAALIEMGGHISAAGGTVLLKAAAVRDVVRNIINVPGSISADSATGHGGTIILLGGADTAQMGGTVTASGTLSARATGTDGNSGNGGFIETSGEFVNLDGIAVSTASATGNAGTWLIDPIDFTVAASGGDITGATLSSNLANNNVTILSSGGAILSGSGNINVNDAVNWGANTLTLTAAKDININAVLTATGSSRLTLNTGTANGADASVAGGQVNMGLTASGFTGRVDIPTRTGTGILAINGVNYAVIQSLGAVGDAITAPATITLQGMAAVTSLAGSYALGTDIDASETSSWNAGFGFMPIGIIGTPFAGAFNGLGHTITSLVTNRPLLASAGLIGEVGPGASIGNVGLSGGTLVGGAGSGGLLGQGTTGTINNSYNTGSVTGGAGTGGLVGALTLASISNSFTTGVVQGGAGTGGLLGGGTATNISNSFTTGQIIGLVGAVRSAGTGGLVGAMTTGNVSDSYTTGDVSGAASSGGLVGNMTTGNITNAYATGAVSGAAGTGGLIGTMSTGNVTSSYAQGAVSGAAGTGGLIGTITTGTISLSYAIGNVAGAAGAGVGGVVGTTTGLISQTYATGNVSGGTGIGGLAGTTTGPIENSYATGNITTPGVGGGLAGTATGPISNSYAGGTATLASGIQGLAGTMTSVFTNAFWDQTKNPNIQAVGGGIGKNTADMMTQSTFTGWDFATIWILDAGITYPLLGSLITPLTVTAADASKTYNGLGFSGGNGVVYSLPGSAPAGALSYSGTAQGASNVGSYTITPAGLVSNQQYRITFVSGALTITARPLSIVYTAAAASSIYGNTPSGLTGTGLAATSTANTGLVNGDTLSGSAGFTTTADGTSGIGGAAITGAGLGSSSNYTLTASQAAGNATALTITARPLSIVYTAAAASSIYGNTPFGLTGTGLKEKGSCVKWLFEEVYVPRGDFTFNRADTPPGLFSSDDLKRTLGYLSARAPCSAAWASGGFPNR